VDEENELIFQDKARLEVSGILEGSDSLIRSRVRQKKDQTKVSDGQLPAYVIVVEYSKPVTQVVRR
jgi:hypothetical protein